MVKWLVRTVIALPILVVAVVALQMIASESGEVVVLHARGADGGVHETRLWVADLADRQYLRVGGGGSGWFDRVTANPDIEVARAGILASYRAVPDPDRSEAINALMRAKYGWRDSFIGALVGGREGSIPIRLEPRPAAARDRTPHPSTS